MSENPFNITKYRKASFEKHKATLGTPNSTLIEHESMPENLKRSTNEKKKKKKKSIEDIKELLKGYDEIPRNEWKDIKRLSYIIYFKNKEGNPDFNIEEYKDEYQKGGFIQFIKPVLYEDGTERMVFGISWQYRYDSGIRTVPFDTIKSVWKKRRDESEIKIDNSPNSLLKYRVDDISKEIINVKRGLEEKIDYLESKVVELRGNLENLVEVVAELHKSLKR